MLIIVDNKAVMSHVGDSRLYLFRDNDIHLLSADHTYANEMLQRGVFTLEQFEASPFHHVLTRSIGRAEVVESEMLLFDLLPGDTFLLCSDGLTRYVEDPEELTGVLDQEDLTSAPEQMVELANRRGGKDNITAIVVRAVADPAAADEEEDTRLRADALQSTFLCEGMPYNRLIRLVELSRLRTCPEGTEVQRENESCEGLHVIVEGRVAICRNGDMLYELCRGDCICETALVRERKARATIRALEPTTLLILPGTEFRRLTRRFPKMGRILLTRLLEYLAARLDDAVDTA